MKVLVSQSCSAAPAAKSLQSCQTLYNLIDGSPQASLSIGFSRQEYWSGQEVCKSNLRPGFAESAGGMSEAGSRGRATGRRAAPQAKSWGLSWWAGAQRGAEGSLLPPGPPGVD